LLHEFEQVRSARAEEGAACGCIDVDLQFLLQVRGARVFVLAAMWLSAEERKHGEHTTVLVG
jgi:hypothetical protein